MRDAKLKAQKSSLTQLHTYFTYIVCHAGFKILDLNSISLSKVKIDKMLVLSLNILRIVLC